MQSEHYARVQRVIEEYLRAEHPDRLDEFGVVFDHVYGVVLAALGPIRGRAPRARSIEFQTLADDVVVPAIIAASVFFDIVAGAFNGVDSKSAFDEAEAWLLQTIGHASLVVALRERIHRVVERPQDVEA